MEVIVLIFIFIVIAIKNSEKQGSSKKRSPAVPNQSKNKVVPNQAKTKVVLNQTRPQTASSVQRMEKTAAQLKEEIWARLSEESKAKISNRPSAGYTYSDGTSGVKAYGQEGSAANQIQKRRLEERNTSILDRAKGNNAENAADVTLDTMEAEHKHSERVAPAVHHHPEDILPENLLGTVEDLMVKGYDGNLCFERDFLGEGLDMISNFTAPTEMPDFTSSARG